MIALTPAIAALGSILVIFLRPLSGLIVYTAILVWYPTTLTIKVGAADFAVGRIVAMVFVAKLLLRPESIKKFRLIPLDALVAFFFFCQIVSSIFTDTPMKEFMLNRAGEILDLLIPYFIVRMVVTTKEDYFLFLKFLLFFASPLAILGLYQSLTGHNVVDPLLQYSAWGSLGERTDIRYGFYRACVTFPNPIHFGLFFVMVGSFCAGLLHSSRRHKLLYIAGFCLLGVGLFSSMSSGPILAGLLSIGFLVFFRYRKYWKPVLLSLLGFCLMIEIISNRHFYDVLSDFTMNKDNAWYRSALIRVALYEGGMSGHWIFGYGYNVDPGWNERIDGRSHTDLANHYLIILSRFGLVGFAGFIAFNIVALKKLIEAFRISVLESDKWLVWSLAALMFALSGFFLTSSLFGQTRTLYYFALGLCGVMPLMVTRLNHSQFRPHVSNIQVLSKAR